MHHFLFRITHSFLVALTASSTTSSGSSNFYFDCLDGILGDIKQALIFGNLGRPFRVFCISLRIFQFFVCFFCIYNLHM
jgi:hypothetical protein